MERTNVFILLFIQWSLYNVNGQHHGGMNLLRPIRERFMSIRPGRAQPTNKKEICYDMIGCFDVQRKHSIKKSPQSPKDIDTQFWLYTRKSAKNIIFEPQNILLLRDTGVIINYGDSLKSLNNSGIDPKKPTKVLIHGFKGSGKEKNALVGVREFLLLEDVNVIVVDWEKGASDSYPTAAANTELIGRQTAIVLMDIISLGVNPQQVHIIGFSLGAHIAGCAGEMIKNKINKKLGRITGLDPASPLFKHQFFRESATKLDKEDANFVDIIHTDGSPVFTDGFGLLSPIGHVDFFPNGGREQPGCNDGRGSVVVSHIEGTINSSVSCSHVRAWFLFLESMKELREQNGCQFIGFPCPRGNGQFSKGHCFSEPINKCLPGDSRCNIMGMGVYENGARGALYLVTKDLMPYCGEQLQATVNIAPETQESRGYLHMRLVHGKKSTSFKFNHELSDLINGGTAMNALSAAERGTIDTNITPTLLAVLSFQSLEFQNTRPNGIVFIDNVSIKTNQGQQWNHCGRRIQMQYIEDTHFSIANLTLTSESCN